jgi:hypothetical protein
VSAVTAAPGGPAHRLPHNGSRPQPGAHSVARCRRHRPRRPPGRGGHCVGWILRQQSQWIGTVLSSGGAQPF